MSIRNNKEFGEVVRIARQKQKLRQVDLARKASVRQALISEIENGTTSARLDTVIKVLAALVRRKRELLAESPAAPELRFPSEL